MILGYEGSLVNRSSNTGTQNTWTQVMAAKSGTSPRQGWFIQNISDTPIEVGLGASGAEVLLIRLAANESCGEQYPQLVWQGRIAVRCTTAATKSYLGHEK